MQFHPPAKTSLASLLFPLALLPLAAFGQTDYATPYTFTTLAGTIGYGSADGTNNAARFASPFGAAVDTAGNLYVADSYNHTIRKITPSGTNWVVTTIAGLAGYPGAVDGLGSAARFNSPYGAAVDANGNVYVADSGNNTIREVTPAGEVTTLAGTAGSSGTANGTGSAARFNLPKGLAVDTAGNLYVGDEVNDTIRKLTPSGTDWVVTTLAGTPGTSGSLNGAGTTAQFFYPRGVAVDTNGNVYVADSGNNTIRKVGPAGFVTTLAGSPSVFGGTNDGNGTVAQFDGPKGIAVDTNGNLYVADFYNDTIRKLSPSGSSWIVTTIAGLPETQGSANGDGPNALFDYPSGIAVDAKGNLYVADSGNNTIRQVTPLGTNWVVTTPAGLATGGPGSADGTGSAARFYLPAGVAVDTNGNVYVADTDNNTIRQVTPAGVTTTLAGLAGNSGANDGIGGAARFYGPYGVAVDANSNVYVADTYNDTIRKLTPSGSNWVVTTLAGKTNQAGLVNGTGTNAEFANPFGVAVDTNGNVYVADTGDAAIRKITPAGVVTTLSKSFSSSFGTGTGLGGLAVDTNGNVYVTDFDDEIIRKVTPAGVVTTLAGMAGIAGTNDGTGTAARFYYPWGIAVDGAGNLYVGDNYNSTIRKITPVGTTWVVTTLAGLPETYGAWDGTGAAAQFNSPEGVAVDGAGNLYVADSDNDAIRKGFPASSVTPPVLHPPALTAGQLDFGITGLTNLAVNIQSSIDLFDWQILSPVILQGGTNTFFAPTPSIGAQFYRAQVR